MWKSVATLILLQNNQIHLQRYIIKNLCIFFQGTLVRIFGEMLGTSRLIAPLKDHISLRELDAYSSTCLNAPAKTALLPHNCPPTGLGTCDFNQKQDYFLYTHPWLQAKNTNWWGWFSSPYYLSRKIWGRCGLETAPLSNFQRLKFSRTWWLHSTIPFYQAPDPHLRRMVRWKI